MREYKVYKVKASSFEGRIPGRHSFTIAAKNEEDVREGVNKRWPELYDIIITKEED